MPATLDGLTKSTLLHGVCAFRGGQGSPIVLLPGWPQTVLAYRSIIPQLSAAHEVWAIDLPGTGESAPSPTSYDTDAINTIIADALEDAGCPRYHLVGHDVGAWVAFALAARFARAVQSLTLLDSAIPGHAPALSYPLPDAINLKMWQFSFNRVPDLPELLVAGKEREFLDWFFDAKAKHPARIDGATRARYAEYYARPGAMARGFAYYRAFDRSKSQNLARMPRTLTMPVLALGGEAAVGEGLKASLESLAGMVEGGIVRDCGHYLMEEQPADVCERVLSFIARHS